MNTQIQVEYIYLDSEERRQFSEMANEYVITSINNTAKVGGSDISTKKCQYPTESKNINKKTCGVCLDITKNICIMPYCKNYLCLDCLKKWEKNSCPLCRQAYKNYS